MRRATDVSDLPPELIVALESDDAGPLDAIIRARRAEDLAQFRRLLSRDDTPEMYRIRAMYALARWGDPSVVPEIEHAIPKVGERGRIAAIDAMGRLRSEQAIDTIAAFRNDPSPHMRKTVARALSRIGGPRAQQELRVIAEKDPVEWVRNVAKKNEPKEE